VFNWLQGRSTRLSKIRVLLADDNSQVLEYVRQFLSANGFEVIGTVTDGQSAVEAAARLVPDVLVLDISMPILNGIHAARSILKVNPSIKIVFLTVYKDPDTFRAALETSAHGYVLKPRLANDLIPAIEHAKEGRRFVSPELA
jgi:DNA-binding NarL/FixJ family response regulator